MVVEFDVPAVMRDGTVLRADVYYPDGSGPWPTLLLRTPYMKDDHATNLGCGIDPVAATRQGFLVIVQDLRGRGRSDGRWTAFVTDPADGYDSVEWAARLPGSSGRVAMYGSSYCG